MPDSVRYGFSDKVAIVTGAAQGIGEQVARRLAAGGARVMLADFNLERAEAVAATLGGQEQVRAMRVDITKPDEIEAMVAATIAAFGRLTTLVNNASNVAAVGARDGDIVTTSMETWDEVYAANLRGPAAACKFAIPPMIAAGGGAIVNVGSNNGMAGDLVRVAYGASKAAVAMLTNYVAAYGGPHGIRCNAVAPGLIMSPPARAADSAPFIALVGRHTLIPGQGDCEDVAETILFLASDAARWITGETVAVDGGLGCQLPWVADLRGMLDAGQP